MEIGPWLFYGNAQECMKQLERWKRHHDIEYLRRHEYMVTEKGRDNVKNDFD